MRRALMLMALVGCHSPTDLPDPGRWEIQQTEARVVVSGEGVRAEFTAEDAWTLEALTVNGQRLIIGTGYNGMAYRMPGGDWIGTGHGSEHVQEFQTRRTPEGVQLVKLSSLGGIDHRATWDIAPDGLTVAHEWVWPEETGKPSALYAFMFQHPNSITNPADADDGDGEFHDIGWLDIGPARIGFAPITYSVTGRLARAFVWDRPGDNKLYLVPELQTGANRMTVEVAW